MDSLVTAAAHALAIGDPLGALKRVALRQDAAALALRGIAMAQLGDFSRAKLLLRQAARAFSPREAVARARCIVAEAEVSLAARDLAQSMKALSAARTVLEQNGDRRNAAHARYLEVRHRLLVGKLDDAERILALLATQPLPDSLLAAHHLLAAGIAMRRLHASAAHNSIAAARKAAAQAAIPSLLSEIENAARILDTPAARLISGGSERLLLLEEVETLLASGMLIVDACRRLIRRGETIVSLTGRPVLFDLARTLAEAWPGDASRDLLLNRAFAARFTDESHRARLRVEIGRLRRALRPLADISATKAGFQLVPHHGTQAAVLARPVEEPHSDVLACLADGESWSTSALSLALGASQRTVQRALETLTSTGKVQAFGHGRSRRWMTPPPPGFTTILLLPAPIPVG